MCYRESSSLGVCVLFVHASAKSFFGYEWNDQIEAFVNTLETVIQLHAEYGIDITTKPYIRGIQDTFWAGTCDLV